MLDFPSHPIDQQTFTALNGVIYKYQTTPGVWRSVRRVTNPFPAGDATNPGLAIGQTTSGIAQLLPHTLTFVNQFQAAVGAIDFKGAHVLDNKSLVIGTPTPVAALPNQSAIEVNTVAGQQPMQINEWAADSAAVEPVIFHRSRGTAIGVLGAVLSGDGLGTLQFQGDLGDGSANIAAANIYGRVQSGWVNPGTGIVSRRLGGNISVATAVGDGVGTIRTALEVQADGDINIPVGNIQMAGVTVIDGAGTLYAKGFRTARLAIADDGVFVMQPYGGTTSMITFLSTNSAAASAPVGTVFVRVNTLVAPQAVAVLFGTGITYMTGALTGTTGTDVKLNISSDAVGNAYFENRLGSSRTYTFHVISGAA